MADKITSEQDRDPCCIICSFVYCPRIILEGAGAKRCSSGEPDDGVHGDNFICSPCAEKIVACPLPNCKLHLEPYSPEERENITYPIKEHKLY